MAFSGERASRNGMKLNDATVILACLSCLALSGCASLGRGDSGYASRIVGTWAKASSSPTLSLAATTVFRRDGTFSSDAEQESKDGKKIAIHVEGSWRIEDGFLVEIVGKSNIAPPGFTTRDRIVRASATEFVYLTDKNATVTYTRLK